jgi:hypothetical protein
MITNDLPLFATHAGTAPLHRRSDAPTAIAAAEAVADKLSGRQAMVLAAFTAAGAHGLTDRELEQRREFAQWAPSTARKRRSELFHLGRLVDGGRRDGLTVWRLA